MVRIFYLDYRWQFYVTHPWVLLAQFGEGIWAFCQRGWRGYADRDTWSLNSYLDDWMPEAVRSLKGGHGFPASLLSTIINPSDEECADRHALWQKILEDIALGFEAGRSLEEEFPMPDTDRYKELYAQRQKGFSLFAEHFESLWD